MAKYIKLLLLIQCNSVFLKGNKNRRKFASFQEAHNRHYGHKCMSSPLASLGERASFNRHCRNGMWMQCSMLLKKAKCWQLLLYFESKFLRLSVFYVLFRYNKNVSFSCSFSDGDFNLGRSNTKRNERCWNFHLPGPYYARRGHLRVLQYNHHTRIFVFSLKFSYSFATTVLRLQCSFTTYH